MATPPDKPQSAFGKWRTAAFSLIILAVALMVTGVTLVLLDAGKVTQQILNSAEGQARYIANTARTAFELQLKRALYDVGVNERTPSKFPPWSFSDFPDWIDGIYAVDHDGVREILSDEKHGEALLALVRATNQGRTILPQSSFSPQLVTPRPFTLGHETVRLAELKTRGRSDRPLLVIARVDMNMVRQQLIESELKQAAGLELVPNVPPTDGSWIHPFSGAMGTWALKPKASFVKEQRDAALYQTAIYITLTVLALVTMMSAMYVQFRLVRHEVALADMKSNFVADVSHELKTPLALIRLFGETLQSGRVKDEAKLQEYYSIITRESTRLTNLINNLLDFARINAGKKEYNLSPMDAREIVQETYEAYRLDLDHHGFTHSFSSAEDLPQIRGDRDALARATLNLISNAIKYAGEECYLHIDIRTDTRRGRYGVLVSFEDHGIGIKPEDRARLFEGFFRSSDARVRSKRGTGLGLSLVKHIVDAHEGYLDVESRLVQGTTFRIFLPAIEQPPHPRQRKAAALRGEGVPLGESGINAATVEDEV